MIELKDAVFQMKPGDKFNWQNRLDNCLEMNKSWIIVTCDGDRYPMSARNMKLKGEIIRAEPEVLSAEEMAKIYEILKPVPDIEKIIDYGNAMHQNGELSMWLTIKKELDRFKKIGTEYIELAGLITAVESLNPIKEPKQ